MYNGAVTINSYGNIQHVSVTGMDPTNITDMLLNVQYVQIQRSPRLLIGLP